MLGGFELLPGLLVQVPPQPEGAVSAKPLKELGAEPPLMALSFAHCAPQNVTELPMPASRLPITKVPLLRNAVTSMRFDVPVIELFTVSVAVMVWLPVVVSVAAKVPVPFVKVELPGSFAAPSVLVKCAVPVWPSRRY